MMVEETKALSSVWTSTSNRKQNHFDTSQPRRLNPGELTIHLIQGPLECHLERQV
jgi:hypothetical protein